MFKCTFLKFSVMALTAFSPSLALAQLEGTGGEKLTVRLQIPEGKQAAFKGSEPILIDFLLSNPSASAVRVLVWRTPFQGVTADIFDVGMGKAGPGAPGAGRVGYIGPIVKRGPPGPEDFITLQPGETRRQAVDLAQYYAIYQTNDYSVAFRPVPSDAPPVAAAFTAAPDAQPLQKIAVDSNAVTFAVVEPRQPAPKLSTAAAAGTGPTFDSCSASQQSDLKAALPAAGDLANNASDILAQTPAGQRPMAQRYKMWFGAHSSARYDRVSDHYGKIKDAFGTKQIEIGCAGDRCSNSTFAYVFPTSPYKIYVCPAFWRAALNGTDSRAGTLIHEMSHFVVVSGTDDIVYGQAAARQLAAQRPDDAIGNADNHEYFAENDPNLPM